MKTTHLVFALVALCFSSVLFIGTSFGQQFLNYKNDLAGIQIDYPKNWVYQESGGIFSKSDWGALFYPSETINITNNITNNRTYDVVFAVAKTRNLPFNNMQLDMYLNYIKKLVSDLGNNITSVEKIVLNNGTDAYKLSLTSSDSKILFILFNKSPDSYYFFYKAKTDKFDKYLPVVNQMLKTFSFTNYKDNNTVTGLATKADYATSERIVNAVDTMGPVIDEMREYVGNVSESQ